MNVSAKYTLPGTREHVFDALIDPAVLARCIPGCEEMTRTGENTYQARLRMGFAGVKGLFTGQAELRDQNPPASFSLHVDGTGTPGFVRGRAEMVLTSSADGTAVGCMADVQVGGLIASVGSRLVAAVARRTMDEFFGKLAAELQARTRRQDV